MTKDYVNFIAMTALTDYPRDVKLHPTYGWRICNFAGEGDSQPNRKDIYENPYGAGYSFADAVMIAAGNKDWQPNNDIWVEPDECFRNGEWTELCQWIIQNNIEKEDYTTLENTSAGRLNLPNHGGVSNRLYDDAYKTWVEQTL